MVSSWKSDVVSDVAFHPFENMFATVSGQRHFDLDNSDSDSDDEDHSVDTKSPLDNSLKIWRY
ncbi:hypothetical protein H4219_005234 [Mycoemilia scoparia]|uniref:Uncharacterized protein n=1 Tax=Mycoemilia scoparia TaxID=417184 RepID=A0A9W7ZUI8_9FUNG|nr:hypothetical protein H4219_005234 [Mycoemilia scoparia]